MPGLSTELAAGSDASALDVDDDFNFDYDVDAEAMPTEGDLMASGCYGLAIVLHEKTGLPLWGLFDDKGACHHAFVYDADTDIAYDARGGLSLSDVMSYRGEPCRGTIAGVLDKNTCEALAVERGFDDDEYDLYVDYAEEHDDLAQLLSDAYGTAMNI